LGKDRPVVLCAVDWIGIGNEGHDAFRQQLATAAGTTVHRVAVHSLHQHDAPECDFGAEKILREAGVSPWNYEGTFARELLGRLSTAVARAAAQAQHARIVGEARGAAEAHLIEQPMAAAIQAGTYASVEVLRPFIHERKEGIAAIGARLGVEFARTWSCYKGGEHHCGKCGTCVERKEAFAMAGLEDPTEYEAES
jgi:hypothetical protein